jgi:prevent-host-death family protein
MTMKTIAAGTFKTHCLKLMDDVRDKRESIVITKNGTPVAKLVPVPGKAKDILGCMRGAARIVDLVTPLTRPGDWGKDPQLD